MKHLLDQIVAELKGKNLLGEIKYVCLNNKNMQKLIDEFEELFRAEYEEFGRKPNKHDLDDYFRSFKIRIIIDELPKGQSYKLLSEY